MELHMDPVAPLTAVFVQPFPKQEMAGLQVAGVEHPVGHGMGFTRFSVAEEWVTADIYALVIRATRFLVLFVHLFHVCLRNGFSFSMAS
jgi:hypothetical protein